MHRIGDYRQMAEISHFSDNEKKTSEHAKALSREAERYAALERKLNDLGFLSDQIQSVQKKTKQTAKTTNMTPKNPLSRANPASSRG